MKYFLLVDQSEQGPFTKSQLLSLWETGRITADARYWTEGMAEWRPVSELCEPMIWRAGDKLVAHVNATFPDRCIKTNQPAHGKRLKRRLAWHSPALYFLLFSPLIYLIVGFCIRKCATIEFGISDEVLTRRKRALAAGWILSLVAVLLVIFGAAKSIGFLIILGIIAFLSGLVCHAVGAPIVRPSRIDAEYVWLKGVNKDYLEEFPNWRGNQALVKSNKITERTTAPVLLQTDLPPSVDAMPPPLPSAPLQHDALKPAFYKRHKGLLFGSCLLFSLIVIVGLILFHGNTWTSSSSLDLSYLAKTGSPSVAQIIIYDVEGNEVATGTGFFISQDGRMITNYHVIEDAASAVIKTKNQAFYAVEGLLAYSSEGDLALLKIKAVETPFLTLEDKNPGEIGERVVVIGSPLGLEDTLSEGIISAKRGFDTDAGYLQITAPISHGSSGSPVLNRNGRVIGIATLGSEKGQALNFAIPVEKLRNLIGQIGPKQKILPFPQSTAATTASLEEYDNAIAKLQIDLMQILRSLNVEEKILESINFNQREHIEAIAKVVPQYATSKASDTFLKKSNLLLKLKDARDATIQNSKKKNYRLIATTTLNQARMLDMAKDRYALEYNKSGNILPAWSDLFPYLEEDSTLQTTRKDPFGNEFIIGTINQSLRVNPDTKSKLRSTTGGDAFWGPYS